VVSLTGDLVKYVPGQRAGFIYTLRWRDGQGVEETRRVYAKAYQGGRADAAATTLRQIAGTEACRNGLLRIPALFCFDAPRGILWQEYVSGTKLSKDESAEGLRRNAAAAGRSLAAFHASTLHLGPGKDLMSQVKDLRKAHAAVSRSCPAWRDECSRITERLLAMVPRLPPVPVTPVHGSFKSSHLFEDQGQLVLIDFDGAGLGDPMYDVGRFLARVVAGGAHTEASGATIHATLEQFQQAYSRGAPWGWPEPRVRWSTCAHLVGSQVYKSVKRANLERIAATLRVATAWLPDDSMPESTT
jgi:aminoglycoside phosphotransferase (APT) family kinase protein